MKLNDIQEKIINDNSNHILILAGAGSGKTTTLKHKILSLLNLNTNIKILCITFTKKSAFDLKEKINNENIDIFTFHSFCYKHLKDTIIKDKNIAFDLEKYFSKKKLLKISLLKNNNKESKKHFFKDYQNFLEKRNLIDFDDLLILFLKNYNLFKINYDYILIDEFQDTNNIQYEILKKIIKLDTKTIAVGDFDQSIYKFRGSNNKIIDNYINDYNSKVYILNYNYRSDETIVNMSNKLIKNNIYRKEKELLATKQMKNNLIQLIEKDNYNQVYEDIFNKIRILRNKLIDFDNMAILSRNNKELTYLKKYINEKLIFYDKKPKILTIHQSKGLEFDYCFIIGLEKNKFPSKKNNQYLDIEEERRLFYVAITRAKEKLFLYYSKFDLEQNYCKKSIFLEELDL